MEELLKTLINEQRKTNELLMYGYQGKNPNELLTIKQVHEEFGIGINKVQEMISSSQVVA